MSQRKWMLFLFGVILSTFVGGGIRVLLSPEVVSKWVEGVVQRKQPKFNFKFETAKLSLADGWRPHLAVEITDLVVSAKDKCVTESVLQFDRVLVPIEFAALMKRKIQLGHVLADNIELDLRQSVCSAKNADELETLESFFRRRWNKEIVNTSKFITELSIQQIRVRQDSAAEPKFHVTNVNVEFLAAQSLGKATFEFWPGLEWVGSQPFGATQTALHISSDGMKWSAKGNLKEGQIHMNGSWRVEKNNLTIGVKWTDVPVAPLAALLTRWQMINLRQFEPRNQWSTCELNAQGPVREWRSLLFRASRCRLSGDYGEVQIVDNEWPILKGEMFPLKSNLKNIDLKKVSALFDPKAFKNFSNFGTLNGTFSFSAQDHWRLQGALTGAEIYAPVFDGNYKRPLGLVEVDAEYTTDHLRAQLSGTDAFAMNLDLVANYEKPPATDMATVRARLNSKPKVQISDATIYKFPFQTLDFKIEGHFDGHLFTDVKGDVNLADIELKPEHAFHGVAKDLGLTVADDDTVKFQKVDASFDLSTDGIHVRGPIQTSIVGKELRFDTWVRGGVFQEGRLVLLDKGKAVKNLDLEGDLAKPEVQPSVF